MSGLVLLPMTSTVLLLAFSSLTSISISTDEPSSVSFVEHYGGRVFVVDGLLQSSQLQALAELVAKYNVWAYQYRDPFLDIRVYDALPSENPGNVDWLTWLDVQFFEQTGLWRRLRGALEESRGKSGTSGYRPYSISAFLLRRLDQSTMARDCPQDSRQTDVRSHSDVTPMASGDITMVVYMNKNWLKNNYGELLLYNERGEVAASVTPKYGRVVIWDCSVQYHFHPPSVAFKQAQYGLIIRATQSNETYQRGIDQMETLEKFYLSHNMMDFALVDEKPVPNWNLSTHLTRKFTDNDGKLVVVYDDVLSKEELDELRSYLITYHDVYHYQIHDESLEEDSDNVQWVAGLRNEEFVKSRLWTLTQRVTEHATNKSDWYPYDVALNIIRGADYTRIHQDCDDFEDEMTLLIYLNPEYNASYHGETAFFNEVESEVDVEPGNEEYELFAAVKPLYGRLCLFHGTIPHSARPPSINFPGARYTFAVKLSTTPQVAKAKNLQEILEGGYSRDPRHLKSQELQEVLQTVRDGQMGDEYHQLLPSVAFLAEQIKKQTTVLLTERNQKRNHAMDMLKSVVDTN